VNVFWHHHIADDYEPVALARLFQNLKEGIAAPRGVQKRQSAVAGGSDKVQVMSAVSAVQAAGHDTPYGTGSIVPALAKNARTGHPQFRNGKERARQKGGPPARIGLDVHGIPEAGGAVRPHIDITIKKPGVPSGPGSNLVNIKHWPW